MKSQATMRRSQKGIVLVTSLLILVLITLLALSLVGTSVFEERMSGNTRDRTLAFEAAEFALREAQDELSNPVLESFSSTGGTVGGHYRDLDTSAGGVTEAVFWRNFSWDGATGTPPIPNAVEVAKTTGKLDGQARPKYVLEEYPAISCVGVSKKWPPPPARNVYKITARGQGQTTEAVVILQAWYDRGCG